MHSCVGVDHSTMRVKADLRLRRISCPEEVWRSHPPVQAAESEVGQRRMGHAKRKAFGGEPSRSEFEHDAFDGVMEVNATPLPEGGWGKPPPSIPTPVSSTQRKYHFAFTSGNDDLHSGKLGMVGSDCGIISSRQRRWVNIPKGGCSLHQGAR